MFKLVDNAKNSSTQDRSCNVVAQQQHAGGVSLMVLDRTGDGVCGVKVEFFDGEIRITVCPPEGSNVTPQVKYQVEDLGDILSK